MIYVQGTFTVYVSRFCFAAVCSPPLFKTKWCQRRDGFVWFASRNCEYWKQRMSDKEGQNKATTTRRTKLITVVSLAAYKRAPK